MSPSASRAYTLGLHLMNVQGARIGIHLFMRSLRQEDHSRWMHVGAQCNSLRSGDLMHNSDTAVKDVKGLGVCSRGH